MKIPITAFAIDNTNNNIKTIYFFYKDIKTISCQTQNKEFLIGCLGCHMLFPILAYMRTISSYLPPLKWQLLSRICLVHLPLGLKLPTKRCTLLPAIAARTRAKTSVVDPVFLLTHPFLLTPTPCYMIEPSFRQFFFFTNQAILLEVVLSLS